MPSPLLPLEVFPMIELSNDRPSSEMPVPLEAPALFDWIRLPLESDNSIPPGLNRTSLPVTVLPSASSRLTPAPLD